MDAKFNMPLYTPGKNNTKNFGFVIADLRSKKSELAYAECKNGEISISREKIYETSKYSSLEEIISNYIISEGLKDIQLVSIAVPGPVINGKCETPNLPWILETSALENTLAVKKVYLINDLEATAYSFMEINKPSMEILHTSENKLRGNVAVLAPGNGLGEAGMFWDGESLRPFATEGGHTEFSPRNDFEVEFYQFLNKIYGIVAWENVLSKEGIYNIYRFLRDIGRQPEAPELKEKIHSEDFLEVVAETGASKQYRIINLTIEMYGEFLAREANNLVLKLKAIGALIITGEIPDRIFHLISKDKFYRDFKISDQMEHLLKDIPIYLVHNPKGVLQGAAYYGAFFED